MKTNTEFQRNRKPIRKSRKNKPLGLILKNFLKYLEHAHYTNKHALNHKHLLMSTCDLHLL